MSLVIRAYSETIPLRGKHIDTEDESLWDTHVQAFLPSPWFYPSFQGLEDGMFYAREDEREIFNVSYHVYGKFRESLMEFRGLGDDIGKVEDDDPFHLLIWFSDCEGSISTQAVRKLHAAFSEHRDAYHAWVEGTSQKFGFISMYDALLEGLTHASIDGFLNLS